MSAALVICRLVLACVFALAGASKLCDLDGSRVTLRDFGVPAATARLGAVALPIVEIAIAVALLPAATARWGALAGVVLLSAFLVAIARALSGGRQPDCHCFGQLHSKPVGAGTLARNLGLGVVAGFVVIYSGHGQGSALRWVTKLSGAQFGVLAGCLGLMLALVAMAWFLLELLRQNGRILARLELVERRLGTQDDGLLARGEQDGRPGLTVGAPAPRFVLPALEGGRVSLDRLLSREAPVVLVFVDPGCSPCNALLPDVARWQRDAGNPTVALISRGDRKGNIAKAQEHGLRDVLLDSDGVIADAYRVIGTPSAVALGAGGNIASRPAGGTRSITELVESLRGWPSAAAGVRFHPTQPLAASSPGQPQLAAVAPSPPAAPPLPASAASVVPRAQRHDLDGRPVSLRPPRGAATILLFFNPRCGFCTRLLPDIRRWEDARGADSTPMVIISTGDERENRSLELASPVILEDDFATGSKLEVRGTPTAVLIDSKGRITGPPAVGTPAVLELLNRQANQTEHEQHGAATEVSS